MIDLLGKSPTGVSYQQFRCSIFPPERTAETGVVVAGTSENSFSPTSHLKEALSALAETVERQVPDGDGADAKRIVLLRGQIERWFDQTMDRVGGWYKRQVHKTLLIIAAVAVLGMNMDAIAITRHLLRTPNARQALAALADRKLTETGDQGTTRSTTDALTDLKDAAIADLPVGWTAATTEFKNLRGFDTLAYLPVKFIGLAVSVFAISLGIPFWFDVLSKVSNLRAAGKKPSESLATQATSSPAAAVAADLVTSTGETSSAAITLLAPPSTSIQASPVPELTLPADYWSQANRKSDRIKFDPAAAEFSLPNASFLAKASLLAYRPQESVELVATTRLDTHVAFIEGGMRDNGLT